MPESVTFALVTFSAIFFVVDPFAVIPIFLAVTASEDAARRRSTARRAAIVATVTLLVFAIAGSLIFRVLGITIGAFRIAGGILLFIMAIEMLRAQRSRTRTSPEEEREGVERDDVAVIPLGIPMLAGPGSIATVMVLMNDAQGSVLRMAIVIAAILLTGGLSHLVLRASSLVERTLRQTGLNIVTRVMGLILAAIAVQFVVYGLRDVWPQITGAAGPG